MTMSHHLERCVRFLVMKPISAAISLMSQPLIPHVSFAFQSDQVQVGDSSITFTFLV